MCCCFAAGPCVVESCGVYKPRMNRVFLSNLSPFHKSLDGGHSVAEGGLNAEGSVTRDCIDLLHRKHYMTVLAFG